MISSKLTEWDKAILVEYPYLSNLTGKKVCFDTAVDYIYKTFLKADCTWVGTKFFFKNHKDYVVFVLRFANGE